VAASALLSLPSVGSPHRAEAQGEQPNILIIVTDDQRASGTMMRSVMPFTRRVFGNGGTRFARAFATTPLCCPSRASIFTGQYVHNHRARQEDQGKRLNQESTVQYYLQNAGYRTAIFGKYLNGWDVTVAPPYFDRWATFSRGLVFGSNGYYDLPFNVQGRMKTIGRYSTNYIANKATTFIQSTEADDARPWLLYVAPFAPHYPAVPHPLYADAPVRRFRPSPAMLEKDRTDKPPFVQKASRSLDGVRRLRRQQLRTLMSVDDLVERIFAEIWNGGEGRRTLAFFMSDNGFLWREHGMTGKRVPYTDSIRIPLYVRWPGHVVAGGVDGRIGGNIDIAPTILEAAGITPRLPMDGRSLLGSWDRDRILTEFWNAPGVPTWASIRGPSYQYVEYYESDGTTINFKEYYDLSRDPWQLTNLLGDQDPDNDPPPELLVELSDQLAADRLCVGTACP
jgi:arylsulfatase A-like enzyme